MITWQMREQKEEKMADNQSIVSKYTYVPIYWVFTSHFRHLGKDRSEKMYFGGFNLFSAFNSKSTA